MAAYAALVSLVHLIEQIQHHPRPPFYLDNKHAENLIEKVTFLQDFLEVYSHVRNEEVDRLQSRIAEAAYAAEDVIETHVVDQILAQSSSHGKSISSVDFYQDLHKVIQDMDSIKKEVMEIKEKMGSVQEYFQQHGSGSLPVVGSSRSPSTGQSIMVGFDDLLIQLMDKLTRRQSNRQIIPIVGMGGIGKTTLARNVYKNSFIIQHFDICAWATISQEYSVKEIVLELLLCQNNQDNRESLSKMSEEELRDRLYKSLCFRRYLIILDDVWSIEAWDMIKFLFPDNNNGSAIMVTTRLSIVALHFTGNHDDHGLQMNFLDDGTSWSLLGKIVFGEDGCPLQLEKIGREIAKGCKGLPLAIVVIGGLLAKSKKTPEYWKYIAENLHSIVNLEDNERCLNLLYTSYNHLPVHLKPCFLYMGVFKEDSEIYVNNLIKKWVAEGFLKPINGKSLEEVAENYLEDLIDRNLILVHKRKRNGKIASCITHDLLRDLCLREIEKDKFLCLIRYHNPNYFSQGINTQRRVAIHRSTLEGEKGYYFNEIHNASLSTPHARYLSEIRDALQSTTHARTIICDELEVLMPPNFRLLKILEGFDKELYRYPNEEYSREAFILQLVNLRCIVVHSGWREKFRFPSSNYLFWNLQTLIIPAAHMTHMETLEIWKMPLLRHVQIQWCKLPNPSRDDFVLENLQTLSHVKDFRFSKEVVKKTPNIKKLEICYYCEFEGSHFGLNNLDRLHKLETLCCNFYTSIRRKDLLQNLAFPHSLKKLSLQGSKLHWEDISTKIGSLPLLQVLKLRFESAKGPEWETSEGHFPSLKFLLIQDIYRDFKCWTTDNTHFPCLEHLVLRNLYELKEISLSIGDIPTLQSIEIYFCNDSLADSAKRIIEEQEELGNEDLKLKIN